VSSCPELEPKENKSENHELNFNNKTLTCTLILHHRWAEKELVYKNYHNIVIINVGQK
jgi:hypothetical protein